MVFDIEPTSEKWREIVEEKDENKQNRMLRQYVYALEKEVRQNQSELNRLKRENKKMKNDILSIDIVKDAIRKAVSDAYKECTTDYSGMKG